MSTTVTQQTLDAPPGLPMPLSVIGTDANELTLIVGENSFAGWQQVRVTRGIERMPSDFDIMVTERFPGQAGEVVILPGAKCQVFIGQDRVLTGYVDRYMPQLGPHGHQVRIQGRSRCQDIVDCNVRIQGNTIVDTSLLSVVQKLCKPFGINVNLLTQDTNQPIQLNITLGETVYEVVEQICRYCGYLAYDDTSGNLVLNRVGKQRHSSGFAEGINVQMARGSFSMDERFSEYKPVYMSQDSLSDLAKETGTQGNNAGATVYDNGVPRYRPRVIVSEQFVGSAALAELRAQWEMKRRYGRSQQVMLTCDSWRDSGGQLWTPNYLAQMDLPSFKFPPSDWIVGEVNYIRDADRGTVADVMLMPPDAFTPEPSNLLPFDMQIYRDLHGQNP